MLKHILIAFILFVLPGVLNNGRLDADAEVGAVAMVGLFLVVAIPLAIYHSYHKARGGANTESATLAWWLRMGAWVWLIAAGGLLFSTA